MFNHGPSSASQKTNHRLFILPLTFCLLFLLSGCKSAQLQALENSASVVQLTTGREVSRTPRDKDWGFSGPIYPEIVILYEPTNTHTKEDVFDETVTILKKNGWQGNAMDAIVPGSFSGSLDQGQYKISGNVNIDPVRNLVIVIMTIY